MRFNYLFNQYTNYFVSIFFSYTLLKKKETKKDGFKKNLRNHKPVMFKILNFLKPIYKIQLAMAAI